MSQRQGSGQGARGASSGQAYRGGAARSGQPMGSTRERQTDYRQDMRQQPRSTSERQAGYRQDMRQQPRSSSGQMYRSEGSGGGRSMRRTSELQPMCRQPVRRADSGRQVQMIPTGGRQSREAALRERRRRQRRRQKIAVGLWAICIIAISGVLFLNRNNASAAEPANGSSTSKDVSGVKQDTNPSVAMIQGLPAEKFTAHPEWTFDL